MPEVSVIIPNYNHRAYLAQRIDSVLSQTYRDFEVIILDDCSTDGSRDVIELYRGHPHVSLIIYNEQNSGSTFNQWLKGISAARGNYIWIAESDDWCEPTFLENIIPSLVARPDCVIGYCQAYCVVGNEIKAQSSHPLLEEYVEGTAFIKSYMVSTNSIYNASMAVWRKDAFNNISRDFLSYKFVGDWLFWIELSTRGNVLISGRLLNYFRKHDKDVSGRAYRTGLNFLEEIRLLKSMLDKKLVEPGVYKQEVAKKFFYYKQKEKEFLPENKKMIYESFAGQASYNYLYSRYLALSLKHFVYRYIKVITKKYK